MRKNFTHTVDIDKIKELVCHYENVDSASAPLCKEAFDLLLGEGNFAEGNFAEGNFTKGNLDDVIALLDEAKLEKIETGAGGTDARILKAHFLELNNDIKKAEANYLKAVSISPSLKNNLLLAKCYHDQRQLSKAEKHYKHCLNQAKNPEEKVEVLNHLGILQSDRIEYAKAEATYQEILKIQRDLVAVNPEKHLPYMAVTLNKLSVFNKGEQAEAYCREALKIHQDLAAANPQTYLPDVATSFTLLATLQRGRNEYTQAEVSYQEALKIQRGLVAEDPILHLSDMVMGILSLALFYQKDMPNQEASEQYAKEVLSYQAKLEHSPIALPLIEIAKAVLEHWEAPTA
ncbi:MAG: tetratricopeptide repeat protein [Tannerellaceae bacterium]|jgi:tetratricopeptide (TPR) repeat protein|nr:tetratricopeptide repeat protein [Tannerellaceae bacterium]